MPTTVLWLRRDLRRDDLPALSAAHEAAAGGRVLPVFVLDPQLVDGAGAPRLAALGDALRSARAAYDGALTILAGSPEAVLPRVVQAVGAHSVHVSGESTPYGRRRGARVRTALGDVPLVATGTPYAVSPGRLRTRAGTGFLVYSAYARAWRRHGAPPPEPAPRDLRLHRGRDLTADLRDGSSVSPAVRDVLSCARAQAGDTDTVHPVQLWTRFLAEDLAGYARNRDRPDLDATSRLSEQLKFGTLHPRTLLAGLSGHPEGAGPGATRFADQIIWREFYADLLWHRPRSAWSDLREELAGLRYDEPGSDARAADRWQAWCQGRTGYPYVDAGMRQLLHEGWMHNRLRMAAASFLTKDLHLRWQLGARFFLRHLRDGDLASNNHGWQWAAGTGTDAAPYVRVFNPVSQGLRFDPRGDFVRRFVPELGHLAGAAVHEPWRAADGYAHGYPRRIVDHASERAEALARFRERTP